MVYKCHVAFAKIDTPVSSADAAVAVISTREFVFNVVVFNNVTINIKFNITLAPAHKQCKHTPNVNAANMLLVSRITKRLCTD